MLGKHIIVFIDGSNLYHELAENFGKANLNFSAFVDYLVGKNELVKVNYYNVPVNQKDMPKAYREQQKFFSALKKIPKFEVKLGRLERRPGGYFVEKGVDVEIAVDILTHAYANTYDAAILVSGDADFAPAIKAVQGLGRAVINVCFPKTRSFHLNQVCDETIVIDKDIIAKLLWQRR